MTYIENNGFVILTWITLFYIDLNDMKYTALYENKESPFNLRYFSDLNKLFLLNNHKIFYYDGLAFPLAVLPSKLYLYIISSNTLTIVLRILEVMLLKLFFVSSLVLTPFILYLL